MLLIITLLCSGQLMSEDIELYVRSIADRIGTSPQVLIIFDNSGSMSNSETIKSAYDPSQVYPGKYTNGANERAVFFTVGAAGLESLPDPDSDARRFNEAINACMYSYIPLYGLWKHNITGVTLNGYELEQAGHNFTDYTLIEGGEGYYVDRVGEYYSTGQFKQTWRSLRENNGMNATDIMDCLRDIVEVEQRNPGEFGAQNGNGTPVGDGLPVNGYSTGSGGSKTAKSHYLVANPNDIENDAGYQQYKSPFTDVAVVTLYTGNYLNWKTAAAADIGTDTKSRLQIAKESITSVINATATVDFGLALFNINYPYEGDNDGGRIVSRIQTRTATETNVLLNTINNIDAETNTPLCETLYEAYRYFAGKSVKYANENGSKIPWWASADFVTIDPPKDTTAESGGNYISPFGANCRDEAYVIVITDGYPTLDNDANSAISSLSGANSNSRVDNNYLPVLSEWMFNHDVNASLDGDQNIVTYTIGFGQDALSAEAILAAAAENGGGEYFPATDPDELSTALQKALISILEQSASFTSPSVASNNFDRTRSLDNVYYSMFFPEDKPRWPGNLKKLSVTNNVIVDSNGTTAIDPNGNIKSTSYSYWGASANCVDGNSVCADGNDVDRGGVAEYMAGLNPDGRQIYSDIGNNNSLANFVYGNAASAIADLAGTLGVLAGEEETLIKWTRGIDVHDEDGDGSYLDTRSDLFGDPLHSKPLVINYGGTAENQDLRIVVGTNAGFLHMFEDEGSTVKENWAFIPKSLYPNLDLLRDNIPNSGKVYGVDGSPVAYVKDIDGTINSGDGDKVWLYTGMRRGGNQYFGFNVTIPTSPSLMWTITGGGTEFPTLANTWSQPSIALINKAGHDASSPVLIFGAGYVNDSDTSSATTLGRGIYIVDAETGERIWSFTPDANLSNNTQTSMIDAMPGKIATLDSDFDGLVDRLYASDLGGNVWRVDLYGSDPSNWTVIKLAALAGSTSSEKRKFFNEPTVVRTFFNVKKRVSVEGNENTDVIVSKEVPYEGILLGSGDRAHPNSSSVNDSLYLIQDRNIVTQSFTTAPSWSNITEADLFDMTDDPINTASNDTDLQELLINMSTKKGWKIDLSGTNEKSLSSARVIGGVAYFTSYTPPATGVLANSCAIKAGVGTLYAMDLSYGTQIYDWGTSMEIGNRIPDTPVTFAGENDAGKSLLSFIGVGQGENQTGVIQARKSTGEPGIQCTGDCDPEYGLGTYKLHTKVTEN